MQGFLLSLGILLGIVSPQPDPELAVRLFRSNGQLCITVEVRGAVNAEVLKLIQAGNPLQLRITIAGPIGDERQSFAHTITCDPVQRLYTIDIFETAAQHRTANQLAAIDVFGRFYGLRLAPEEDIHFPATIDIFGTLTATGPVSFDTSVLWNYRTPRFHAEFGSLRDYQPAPETGQ